MSLKRIVSGGQTGVDRGALDAALRTGFPCGGWCPAGRLAEDGRIPDRYPLRETRESDYPVRTRKNVEDSDATLILAPGELTGGTSLTRVLCQRADRPCLVIDAARRSPEEAVVSVVDFIVRHRVRVLNVAGPRASGWSAADDYSCAVITALIARAQSSLDLRAAENSDSVESGAEQDSPLHR